MLALLCLNGRRARLLQNSRGESSSRARGWPLDRKSAASQFRANYGLSLSRSYATEFNEGDNDREEFSLQYFSKKKTEHFLKPLSNSKFPKSQKSAVKQDFVIPSKNKPVEEKSKIEIVDKKITKEDVDSRVDRFVSRLFPRLPNSRINKLLRDKKIVVSHSGGEGFRKVEGSERLKAGSVVRLKGSIEKLDPSIARSSPDIRSKIFISPERAAEVRSWVLYKDESLIVLNKPANLAVQGGSGVRESVDDLCEALRFGESVTPKLVHRLDQGASGLLVLARNRAAAKSLTHSFASHEMSKLYWAVCIGTPRRLAGSVKVGLRKQILPGEDSERVFVVDAEEVNDEDSPIGKKGDNGVKLSHSRYHTLAHTHNVMSLLALRPRTGRTHQLRVHCAQVLGTPIFGDYKYGDGCPESLAELLDANDGVHGVDLHLHARELSFLHPDTKKPVHFTAPVPSNMMKTMKHFDYHLMVGDHPYASLTEEEKKLEPYKFEFKESPLKQKLRMNKVSKSTEYQKEKRREFSLNQRAANAPKNLRARVSNEKRKGNLTSSTFKPKHKPKHVKRGRFSSRR